MMRPLVLCTLLALAACHEPSFDERYQAEQKKLEVKTKTIDDELKAAASDAAAAGVLPNERATATADAPDQRL